MIWQKAVRTVVNRQLEHPEILKKQCLNARQGKVRCDKCMHSCPGACIVCPEKGEADWSNCINCGLCAAVCPTGAIEFSRTGMTTIVQAVRLSGASRTIGCAEAAGDVDVRVTCLASLPWEALAAMALAGKDHFVRGHCDACGFNTNFNLKINHPAVAFPPWLRCRPLTCRQQACGPPPCHDKKSPRSLSNF